MAWRSLTENITGVIAHGVTTVQWGTEGAIAGAVVLRYAQRSLVANQKLPNGDGLTITRVLLKDGGQFDVTVRAGSLTPPDYGAVVTIRDGAGLFGTPGTDITAHVVDKGFDAAPGQPADLVLTLERLTLVTPS
jgi:hypothetical protein